MNSNPYVGPRTFTRQEEDRYFGREREGRDLFSLVVSERLVLFYAQSGAGKSSLINTRLIPQLQRAGFAVLPVGRVSGELPAGLSAVDNIFAFNLKLSLDQSENDPQSFASIPLTDFLAGLTSDDGEHYYYYEADSQSQPEAEIYAEVPSVLIIDQFEEIITSHPTRWPERENFFRQLDEAMAANRLLWVVLTLREDYVAALDPYAALLTDKLRARFYMQRMGYEAALEAVEKPAELGGRFFAPGVAESLVDNLRQVRVEGQAETQPGQFVEPVQLQVVCYQLWENLKTRPTGPITLADLQELGNVDTALAEFYQQAIARVIAATGESETFLRDWFERKLITEAGTRGSVYRGLEQTAGLSTAAADLLANQFLLRSETRAGGIWYELVHDRFVEPILQANRDWQLRQSPLIQAAQTWERAGHSKDKLYLGPQLKDALANAGSEAKEPVVEAFLNASLEENRFLEAQAAHEAEKQRAREQSQVAKRRIVMMGILVALTLIVVIFSYLGSTPATTSINKTVDVRAPVALEASRAQLDLRQMVSDMRGYLAVGDQEFRDSYHQSQAAFEADLARLTQLSSNLDEASQNSLNQLVAVYHQWAESPEKLFTLRDDQLEREPAYKLLLTDGEKLAGSVLIGIQNLIQIQAQREPSADDPKLPTDMANFQGSFAAMLSGLRYYVATRNSIFRGEYEANFDLNELTWERLTDNKAKLTPAQQVTFAEIAQNREDFLQLPDQIFEILEGPRWREDFYLFRTETIPATDTMQKLLAEITQNQQDRLVSELNTGRSSLTTANRQIALGGFAALVLGLIMMGIELRGSSLKAWWAARQTKSQPLALDNVSRVYLGVILLVVVLAVAGLICLMITRPPTAPSPLPTVTSTGSATERGAGDTLRLFFWQAPRILNPHLTSSSADWEASRITYEPLASFDKDGNLVPFLAAEIPSLANGGLATDGKSVTWKLKHDIKWSDGEPFTADDVLFTYQFISNPEVYAQSAGSYQAVSSVEVVDDYTVKVNFNDVNPAWYLPFVGPTGMILPRHIFEEYNGPNAREAPAISLPVGTGPYRVVPPGINTREVLFLGNDLVDTNKIVYEPNPYFREADRPYFSWVELRGGGIVTEAARQALQTDEVDFAPNLQMDAETLNQLEATGKGKTIVYPTPFIERIYFNFTNPNQSTSTGERSSLEFPHPFFSDLKVRQAFAYAIDREAIAALYGDAAQPTSNILVLPAKYNSPNTSFEFNPEKAAALLDEAGWVDSNGDGTRDKDGVEMKVLFQTSASTLRQKTQQIIQRALKSIGVDVEIKVIDSGSFFDLDPNNPDTAYHFYADLQMYNDGNSILDPSFYMQYLTCDQIPQQANNWTGENVGRWCNPAYDALYQQSTTEIDPDKSAQLFIAMNDQVIRDVAVIPLFRRNRVIGINSTLTGVEPTFWDATLWNIKDWRRVEP